jgi:hypothetical protein
MLWRSSLPLPLKDLPEEHTAVLPFASNIITFTYESLETVNGISAVQFDQNILAMQAHVRHQDDFFAYSEAWYKLATCIYCPIAKGEAIKGGWLV